MTLSRQDTAAQFLKDVAAATSLIEREEPEDHRKLRTGMLDDRAGCFGQYFGTWDIAHGMLRDCSMYSLYPLVRMARHGNMAVQIPQVVDELLVPYTNYLGYSGFPEFEDFGDRMRALMRSATPEERAEMLSGLLLYVNCLYSWAYHYFPWFMGEHFSMRTSDSVDAALAVDVVTKDPMTPTNDLIRMTWEPLGITVRAWLATDQNQELCADLLDAFPFRVLQEHSMVTGELMFAWAPMTSTSEVRVREEIRKAPLGRLRFSQRTGQKLIIQYGLTKETILAPVLGGVIQEDVHKLAELGKAVWAATYATKKLIWLSVERV